MTAKAKHCDECVHFTRYETPGTVCGLGHRPVFVKPKPDPRNLDWGWKRRCENFKPKDQQ